MVFVHGLLCPIRLIHLIGRKSHHQEKTSLFFVMYAMEDCINLYIELRTDKHMVIVRNSNTTTL